MKQLTGLTVWTIIVDPLIFVCLGMRPLVTSSPPQNSLLMCYNHEPITKQCNYYNEVAFAITHILWITKFISYFHKSKIYSSSKLH